MREQRSPRSLPLDVGDQVLADLDGNVMQATPLTVYRNGVIRRIGHTVGLVVADYESLFALQQFHKQMGETPITIVEHTGMPRPSHAEKDRRETVHRNQHSRPTG